MINEEMGFSKPVINQANLIFNSFYKDFNDGIYSTNYELLTNNESVPCYIYSVLPNFKITSPIKDGISNNRIPFDSCNIIIYDFSNVDLTGVDGDEINRLLVSDTRRRNITIRVPNNSRKELFGDIKSNLKHEVLHLLKNVSKEERGENKTSINAMNAIRQKEDYTISERDVIELGYYFNKEECSAFIHQLASELNSGLVGNYRESNIYENYIKSKDTLSMLRSLRDYSKTGKLKETPGAEEAFVKMRQHIKDVFGLSLNRFIDLCDNGLKFFESRLRNLLYLIHNGEIKRTTSGLTQTYESKQKRRLSHIIREMLEQKPSPEQVLSQPFTWKDVDFIEGDIIGHCEQLIVTVKGVEIPLELINLKAQQTIIGKINLHIFINDKFQNQGIATKIYTSFIHQFGGIYSGFGRMMNKPAIFSIYHKLEQDPDITVRYLMSKNREPIGIEAFLNK